MSQTFLSSDITDALSKLKKQYAELAACDSEIFYIDSKQTFGVCTKYQSIFRLKFDDPAMQALHQQCMYYLLKAEVAGPGSFDVCLRKLLLQKTRLHTIEDVKHSLVPSRSHLSELVSRYIPKNLYGDLHEMVEDALDLAGFSGKIIIERTQSMPHLEHVSGYTFKLKPMIEMPVKTILNDVRIVCLDGHLEDVSEAHHLFEQIAESQQPCALFVRELSNEVKHTIKVNYDRGTMRVIPFTVTFDLEQANTLADIATVAGNDVISRNHGAVISQIKLREHHVVDRIDITQNNVTVFNKRTRMSVAQHLRNLQIKREVTPLDLQYLLDGRIRSLISNTTILRIADDSSFTFRAQLIDFALRAVKSALDYGVERDEENRIQPASLEVIASAYARKLQDSLVDLGAIVT